MWRYIFWLKSPRSELDSPVERRRPRELWYEVYNYNVMLERKLLCLRSSQQASEVHSDIARVHGS